MNILNDFTIELTSEEVLATQPRRKSVSEAILNATEEAIALAYPLINPQLLYRWFDVVEVEKQHVILKPVSSDLPEKRLLIGPYANELKKAQQAMIAVQTIGAALEEKVQDLNDTGELLPGFLLDSAGVVALSKVNTRANQMVEKVAADKGWGVGASLSPGSLKGWPIESQQELCGMLELAKINVQLNETNILVPFKSVSVLIGIGQEYTRKKVGSMCHLCNLKDTCTQRKK